MPGSFFAFLPSAADDDKRPWEQRGFFEVEPVDPYANQSLANQRTGKYEIRPDGSDPKEGYPARQKVSKDSTSTKSKKKADGKPSGGPQWKEND